MHRQIAMVLALAACGGTKDRRDASPSDASLLDAGLVDAGPPDAGQLDQIAPGNAFVLSPGNFTGQDEDPSILKAADNSLYASWYSNRNGLQADGREDKEIFIVRSTDGVLFSDPPIQVTRGDESSFYPSLVQDGAGIFHIAWWRPILIPDGCTPGVDCTGTDNRIYYKSSADGITWNLDEETEVASGPGDFIPSMVWDAIGDRLLIYFPAVVRDAAGNTDLGDSTLRIYVVINEGSGWSSPLRLQGVNPDTHHNTYPHVVADENGMFHMTWTRYDAGASSDILQVISESSTETMYATSADGVTWSAPVLVSGDAGQATIDVFPYLHVGFDGSFAITWLTTALGGTATVEMPVAGTFPTDRVERPELSGYTARVSATATPGVFWGAWVEGANPTQKVHARFFSK